MKWYSQYHKKLELGKTAVCDHICLTFL